MEWKLNDATTHLLRPERRSRAVPENRGGQVRHHNFAHRHRPPEHFPVGVEVTRLKSKKQRLLTSSPAKISRLENRKILDRISLFMNSYFIMPLTTRRWM